MSGSNRPLHIVQVGFDDTLFMPSAPSDTLARQLNYGRELERRCPGSRMSFIAMTSLTTARPCTSENVVVVPVIASRWQRPIKLYRQLKALHREHPLSVISTQAINLDAWTALLFGWRHGVKVIGQVHYDLFSPIARRDVFGPGWRGQLYHALCLRLLRHLFAVRVVGRRVRDELVVRGLHRNVRVIPVPITMKSVDDERTVDADEVSVLFVGRLVFVKNIEDWLRVAQRVAAQLPAVKFKIIGDGPLREALESEAQQLGLGAYIYFARAVPYAELSPIYRSAKVFLLTSHYEGFGRVVAESYLNGVPVVATRITGVEDIVDDGETGFLHATGDIVGLANSVLRLLQDESLRQTMGRLGRERVRARFDPEWLTRDWVDLLISGSQGKTA